MNQDQNLIFEAYKATSNRGTPIYNRPTSAPDFPKGYDAIQNTIDKKLAQKPGTTPPSKVVKDGKGRTITIGDFVSLIDEPEAVGEVREVLPNNTLVIQHDGGHEEVSALDVELRPETEENAEQVVLDEDIDNLYTIIANALDAQGINSQQVNDYLSVPYSKDKGYKISITEV
jgi:hypothetical protein